MQLRFEHCLKILFFPAFIIGALVTLLGFLGKMDWRYDLLSHFREYYLILFIPLLITALYLKLKLYIVAAFIFIIINFIPFIPFYIRQKSLVKDTGVLVLSSNVNQDNRQYSKLIQYVKKVNPDVIVLLEVDSRWLSAVNELLAAYPNHISESRDDNFGILLLSKYPLQNQRLERIGKLNVPTVITDILIGNMKITLIGTHPIPPFGPHNAQLRDDQIEKLAMFINKQKLPTLLVGDLNSSPFSYSYRHLLGNTTLTDCANGFGYQSTWRYQPFIPPFGLSLDHCFHTPGIVVLDSYVGEDIGSDHRPIINKFFIK
jgi:endonuclease/exonuclease/phosphatase (EEP) superfamily protein YafD